MAYEDELRELLANAEARLHLCESDTAYAAILRQVRGLKADIHAIAGDDEADDMEGLLDDPVR